MPKESKFAEKLRELGFEHQDPELAEEADKRRTRTQRRILKSGKLTPSFTKGNELVAVTYVTDEYGQAWVTHENIDLKHLGFIDNTASVHHKMRHRPGVH